ncbi:MAG: sulfite exporter TauE/SafE family protein [Odoribacter splanchnicus]|nr:sulfite exporter TauE/SafE family protein [Odoribacter splanchnicus]MBD9179918.1 sulfite exporter TauE/SafE family protein [Odoribacter splanchnicus]
MTASQVAILIALGAAAGFINTFAGGGSMLTVPFLIFLGLPANVANATNRVAILLQNIVSTRKFRQEKILDIRTDSKLLLPTALGSIAGAFIAVDIHEDLLQKIIAGLLIVMFFMVWFDSDSWVKSNTEKAKAKKPFIRFLIFFGIGFYGGFIQIGVGFILLAGLVLGCGFDLLKANAIKLFIILFYTVIALGIFIYYDLVDWKMGLLLACGNMAGAWLGARLSLKWGTEFIRYILLAALAAVALKLFGVF